MARKAAGKHSRNKSTSSQAQPKSPTSSSTATAPQNQSGTNGSNGSSSNRPPMPLPVSSGGRQEPASSLPGKFRLLFLLFPLLQMLWQLEAPLRPFSALRDPETGEILRRRVRVDVPTPSSDSGETQAEETRSEEWKEEPLVIEPRILMVVPHVRDLGLFAPTFEVMLEGRRKKQSELFVLGLSVPPRSSGTKTSAEPEVGTWDRSFEWTNALEVFGLPAERGFLLDVPELQDDPKAVWQPHVVLDKVLPYVLKLDIDTILTFDERGITGNLQHSAVSQGVVSLIRSDQLREALGSNTTTSPSPSASAKPSKSFNFFKSSSSSQGKEKETTPESSAQTPDSERIYPRAFLLQSPSTPFVNLGPLSPIIQHVTLAYRAIFPSKKSKSETDPGLGLSKAERRTTFVTDIRHYFRGWRALAKISGEMGLVDGKVLKWALERSLWVNEWVEV